MKVKSALRGSALFSAGTVTAPMWFSPINATVSALATRAPSSVPPLSIMRRKRP